MRFAQVLLSGLLLPFAGCTVILGTVEEPMCVSNDECLGASMYAGFPATCNKYFCSEGRCVEYEDGAERCDGWDNDCDGIIDEPSESGDEPWREGEAVVSEGRVAAGPTLRYGSWQSRAVATWAERQDGFHATVTVGAGVVDPEPMSYLTSGAGFDLVTGCRDTPGGVTDCNFSEVASAPAATHEIVATIATDGCSQGRLLIGHTPPTAEQPGVPVVLRTPSSDFNSFEGVDLSGACTGASRPGCDGAGAGCGAARPALAAIDRGIAGGASQDVVAEATVAYLGDAVDRAHCGGPAVPVEAVVATLLRAESGSAYFWTTLSNEAVPAVLGETTGGGAPAVIRWGNRGWLIGFPNEGGEIALHWIPSPEDFPPLAGSGMPTPPIQGLTELGTVTTNGEAPDHLALALGSPRTGGIELGAAWLEGCGASRQRIVFQRLFVETSGTEAVSVTDDGPPVVLETATRNLGPPTLSYSQEGLLVPGFTRGGATADVNSDGGWTLLWATEGEDPDGDELHGGRIAKLDGDLVGDVGRIGATGRPDAPHLYDNGRFLYRDRATLSLVGGRAVCTP